MPSRTKIEPISLVGKPWSVEPGQVLHALESSQDMGLEPAESALRIRQFGPNQLQVMQPRNVLAIVIDQFRSVVIMLLLLAAVISMLYGDYIEGMAILAVIAINTLIGFVTEWRATRSMEALRRLGQFETVVRRSGKLLKIPAAGLVPGDIVVAEAGDIVTADLRLLEASKLSVNESSLTGESTPVSKQPGVLDAETALMERSNMLFKGTSIARGSFEAVVVGTGTHTELGEIAQLVSRAEVQETPLEKRLDMLGRRLVWVTMGIALLIGLAGILAGRDTVLAIQVAVALTVAAIPEGLPIVATIALARGMWRMSKKQALIVRLSAVETLGATSVILTDKTGTLTENRMTVTVIELPEYSISITGTGLETKGQFLVDGRVADAPVLDLADNLLEVTTLCSNAELNVDAAGTAGAVGDPTEIALLVAAVKRGIEKEPLGLRHPELHEDPFDPETKLMATFNRTGQGLQVAVKGAPEVVLPACTHVRTLDGDTPLEGRVRDAFLERVSSLGDCGLRTLAVATRITSDIGDHPYEHLVLLGATGLMDPPRAGVKASIEQCQQAGIRVVMVTGDHLATARNIASDLGLASSDVDHAGCMDASGLENIGELPESTIESLSVVARATPVQKLQLIEMFQSRDMVVAMTGDGVNDAPALKKADIGIAMGLRGTPVAKEAAAMVLQDDRFSTIVAAIRQGRAIYENIQRFVLYLLSCNISEILVVGLATVAGAPLPLLPLQILFLNLVTDVFPALALGVGKGPDRLMLSKPRPANEPILTRNRWALILVYGALMSASVLGAMSVAVLMLDLKGAQAITVSFCTLAIGQVWHVLNMRDPQSPWWNNEVIRNPWMWCAVALCLVLIAAAVFTPGVKALLELSNPGLTGWMVIALFSLLPVLAGSPARRLVSAVMKNA